MEKSYKKVSEYIWDKIYSGELNVGDKIASERELATILKISRNSVREGLRFLTNAGIIASQHGSGNYISNHFEKQMGEMMSYMYVLDGQDNQKLSEFRYALEWQGINIICGKLSKEIKEKFLFHLKKLEEAQDEKIATIHDKHIHDLIVMSTENDYMKCNYYALTKIMSLSIPTLRGKIIVGTKGRKELLMSHRQIVEGLVEDDIKKALKGLETHFKYINIYINVDVNRY